MVGDKSSSTNEARTLKNTNGSSFPEMTDFMGAELWQGGVDDGDVPDHVFNHEQYHD